MTTSSRLCSAQIVYLDFVRATAAQLVLVGHASHYFLVGSFLRHGQAETFGVLLFFLISGFLICHSVIEKLGRRDYSFGTYFLDRFFRIFTPFLPALIFVAIIDSTVAGRPEYPYARDFNLQTWIGNALMLQDYPAFQVLRRLGVPDNAWFIAPFGSARPFWTVSIEWWIYLLFGWIVFKLVRSRSKPGLGMLLVLGLLLIVPFYHFIGGVGEFLTILWIVGAASSLLWRNLPMLAARYPALREHRLRLGIALMAGSVILVAGRGFATGFKIYDLQFALFVGSLLFSALFAVGAWQRAVSTILERGIGFVAAYSYSLYLIHHTLLVWAGIQYPNATHSVPAFLGFVLASNAAAILFWYLFERHYRTLGRWARGQLLRRGRPQTVSEP